MQGYAVASPQPDALAPCAVHACAVARWLLGSVLLLGYICARATRVLSGNVRVFLSCFCNFLRVDEDSPAVLFVGLARDCAATHSSLPSAPCLPWMPVLCAAVCSNSRVEPATACKNDRLVAVETPREKLRGLREGWVYWYVGAPVIHPGTGENYVYNQLLQRFEPKTADDVTCRSSFACARG
eukprot:6209066-Pleurochrysis_carterae.AAC.1